MLLLQPLLGQARVPMLVAQRELLITSQVADLSRVGNMSVGPKGEIAIGQPEEGMVVVISASGSKRTLGRAGEGPGEFRLPGPIEWIGDTLVIPDRVLGRVTMFSDRGVLLGSRRMPVDFPLASLADGTSVRLIDAFPVHVYGDGTYLALSQWQLRTVNGEPSSNLHGVVKVGADGRLQRIVAKDPNETRCEFGKGGHTISIPFCEPETRAIADDGSWVVSARIVGDKIANVQARVTAIDSAGGIVFTRELPVSARPLSRAFADSVVAFRAARTSHPENVPLYRSMKLPAFFPPLRRLLIGHDHSVWLELDTVVGGHLWWILDATGRLAGSLQLPGPAVLQVADGRQIWTLEEDENGLQGVGRYRITRPGQ